MKRWMAGVLLAAGLLGQPRADGVSVAVAANFTAPMHQLAALFKQRTGHTAALAFGSTGKFYAQIRNGAPFHVLLSADDTTPGKLQAQGYAVAGTRFTYAVGQLVLWSSQLALVDPQGAVLQDGSFARLAVAEPKLAPYGAAAAQALTKLGLLERLTPRLVYGENISQAYQFVATGNAPLGFVAMSQVFAEGKLVGGSAWVVPPALYAPIRQEAVLLAKGAHLPAARALLDFLRGDEARAVIRAYGYGL